MLGIRGRWLGWLLGLTALLFAPGCFPQGAPKTLLFEHNGQIWKAYGGGGGKVMLISKGERPRWIPGVKTHFAYIERKGGTPHVKLWVAQADGSNAKALTGFEVASEYSWSPDGQWIAVAHTKDGNYEIYKLPVFGGQPVRLTNNFVTDRYPRWSPQGDKIAFVSTRNADEDIYLINADGTGEKNLLPLPDSGYDRWPAWSGDGKTLAFVAQRGNGHNIWTVDVASGAITKITNTTPSVHELPAWHSHYLFYYAGHVLRRYDVTAGTTKTLGWFGTDWPHTPLTVNPAYVYITRAQSPAPPHIYSVQHYTGDVYDVGVGYAPDVW